MATDNRRLCAALCYALFGIIWFLADDKMRKDAFVKFHAQQGLVLLVTAIAVSVVGTILPIIGWFIILPIGQVLVLIWFIMGVINAFSEKKRQLFWIGQFGKQFKF